MTRFDVSIDLNRPLESLRRTGAALSDLRLPLREMGDAVAARTAQRFETQGFGRWAQLSPAYAARKRRHAPGRKILVLSGALKDAATNKAERRIVRLGTSWLLKYGVRGVRYAGIHQSGGGNVPARRFLVVDMTIQRQAAQIAEAFVRTRVRQNWGRRRGR